MIRIIITIAIAITTLSNTDAQHLCLNSKINFYRALQKNAGIGEQQMAQMEKYDVKHYELNLNAERTSTAISGNVKAIVLVKSAVLDTFYFQLHTNYTVDSVLDNAGNKLTTQSISHLRYAVLQGTASANTMLQITVFYRGTAPNSGNAAIGNGLSNATSPTYGSRVTWSLSQPYSAYEWWPCKQSLQDKIDSVCINVTTDTTNLVGSNGKLMAIDLKPGNKHQFRWKTNYPISYYLISIAVSNYKVFTDYAKPKNLADSILILNYLYNQTAYTNNKANIDATKPMLELFSDLFGIYPFYREKYGHSMAPFSGGMEHQTMTTQGVFPYGIVAHELAHQWFGDNVTCATWKDIWLNEGFATYLEFVALQYLKPAEAMNELTSMQTAAKSANTLSVYCTDTTNVNRIFSSAITYNKGGTVIHILRYLINNDSVFFGMLKAYQQQYKDKNINTEQFKNFVAGYTQKNVDDYFNQWIYGSGYPSYNIRWNYYNGKLVIYVAQQNINLSNNLFSMPLPFNLVTTQGDTQIVINNSNVEATVYTINTSNAVNQVVFDPNNWILKNATVTKDIALYATSTDEYKFENRKINIYPNPANGYVMVEPNFNVKNAAITIFDAQGKLVLETRFKNKIETDKLKKGIYILKLTEENNTYTNQFIKE